MTTQFHEFFNLNFRQVFIIWPNSVAGGSWLAVLLSFCYLLLLTADFSIPLLCILLALTGKSFLEAHNICRTCCVPKFTECRNKTKTTICVHNMFCRYSELTIFMNNLLSYCGLVDAKIRGSEKDLPVKYYSLQRLL